MGEFKLCSEFQPKGDQAGAIEALSQGLFNGHKHQVLLGVTGSGKTFTVANVIERVQKPTLVIVHNKTLSIPTFEQVDQLFQMHQGEVYPFSYYIMNKFQVSST